MNLIESFPCATPRPFKASLFAGRPYPQRRWLVPEMMPAGTLIGLDGHGGGGKSLLALQLACAVVLGKPWLGREVLQGAALYLTAEDDEPEVHRRLADLAVAFDVGLEDLGDLSVLALAEADIDPELAVEGPAGGLALTELWDQFERLLTEQRPALAILDSRADLYGASENDRAMVRPFCGALRRLAQRTGSTVLLIGHPSLSGLQSGGSSGSTAWHNSARARFQLSVPDPEGEPDPDARLLQMRKSNYGPMLPDLRLRRGAGVFHIEGGGAPVGRLGRLAEQHRVDAVFLRLVETYTAEARRVSPNPGVSFAPTVFALDQRAEGVPAKGLRQAMDRLFAAGRLRVQRVGPPSRRYEVLALAPDVTP